MGKRIVIIGAGFAGHTTALYLGNALGKENKITVINRNKNFVYIPSLVWAGIDRMVLDKLQFPLKPVYDKFNVNFFHGRASDIHVDDQYVMAISEENGSEKRFDYDYLVNATGPYLNFDVTPGLGPHAGLTQSICSPPHAEQAKKQYLKSIEKMERGEKQTFVIGTGHGTSTCQGAAFEYITNIHKDLLRRKLRDRAEIKWLSNEAAAGDFGVDGVTVALGKKLRTSQEFIETIYEEYNIEFQVQTAVQKIEGNNIYWENYAGESGSTDFDFAMLIPAFKAIKLSYWDKDGNDVSSKLNNPGGFLLVDGVYGKSNNELRGNPDYWPATYKSPFYPNIYAAGIAFAPPGPISKPFTNKNGINITAAPPRTGMVSGITGRIVAKNIIAEVQGTGKVHKERMTEMYAACIASMGDSLLDGSAAVIMINPVVPDFKNYPATGRDVFSSTMEMGLAGAWMKRMIHSTFMHKLQGRIGWRLIPE